MTEINENVNVEPQNLEVQNHEIKNEESIETTTIVEEKIETIDKKVEETPKTKTEIKPLDDFDWDLIGRKDDVYSKDERTKLEELYGNTFKLVEEGEVVMGTVVAINKREVVVNIGYKSEGIINANEFRAEAEIKVGDKVEVFVENMESIDGQLILSHKKEIGRAHV